MKIQMLAVAGVFGLVLSGCTSTTSSSSAGGSTIEDINSWQSWGQVGQEWLNRCDESNWGCINSQVKNLQSSIEKLPPWSDPESNTPDRILQSYLDDYQDYVDNDCRQRTTSSVGAERGVRCMMADLSLPQSSNAVREFVNGLAGGEGQPR